MKRFTMIVALLLMIAMPMMAERVSPETARKVATTFLNNNGAKASQLTDLSKAVGLPNLYIFNAEQGFVVMATDDCVKPILGYSLKGKFVAEGMPESIHSWLQGYSDEIQHAIDNQLRASSETAQQWKDLLAGNPNVAKAATVVEPLIQTKWDQDNPYNMLCPSGCVTGCVATAMAQVMNYWNYPTHGIGSHAYVPVNNPALGEQFADFNSTNYDWANMTNTYSGSSSDVQKTAVATLMYHCGVSVEMKYGPSSGASTSSVANALKSYFNYSSDAQFFERSKYSDTDWINMLKSDLNQSQPIQYSGSGAAGGHSFICDGYNSDNYFHFNWGWGGSNDGHFSLTNLNTTNGNFSTDQAAVFGIKPADCSAANPTGLSYSQNGRQITLNWTAAEGASSYNIYRNSNYIGNSATTSFSDTAPFGTTAYYVRSVASDGNLSLSSNAVNVIVDYPTPVVDDLEANLSGNNVSLEWTAPEWCFPATESAILTYGDGTPGNYTGYVGTQKMYWGHRYLPSDLAGAFGKVIFRVSFYVREPGTYELNIYEGTTELIFSDPEEIEPDETYYVPTTLLKNKTITTTQQGWFLIDLDEPVIVDTSQDLWVMMYDPEYKQMPAECCVFDEHDRGCYVTYDIASWTLNYSGWAWLIRTYLTDGTYTYNLYQDGVKIANELAATTYNATLNNNAANLFTVKTKYYGGDNDKMTLNENSALTVTGTLSNTNEANLVLKNGAQLIHSTAGVKATVEKSIAPYTANDNGWYFIASPVAESITPSAENGLLDGTYDLYYYNEPTHYWNNYKANTFNLNYKQGYLYANNTATTLQFAGTLTRSDSPVSISGLSRSGETLTGFNLVGNPFACNATINQDCFVISGSQVVLASSTKTFAPCEGAFVKATSDAFTVTFTKSAGAKANENKNCLDLVVIQGKTTLDRARVRFGEGTNLEKFTLEGDESTQLTLWQDGQEYAVAYADGQSEMPINFKAAENGTYSIGIEHNSIDVDYLHLIDNMTGADIDLLNTPTYTFEANTSDYASRFRLVFSNCGDAIGDNAPFALISNGEIHIVETFPETSHGMTLQIMDMLGRVVVSVGDVSGNVSTNGIPAGVFLLRLIDGENVKTQKIVIE